MPCPVLYRRLDGDGAPVVYDDPLLRDDGTTQVTFGPYDLFTSAPIGSAPSASNGSSTPFRWGGPWETLRTKNQTLAAEDTFDSYSGSAGQTLDGLGGGEGWSGNWVVS